MDLSGNVHFLGCDPVATADSLILLARDLHELAAGRYPDADQLRDAPILRSWSFDHRPRPCLKGRMYGHPLISTGNMAVTSELFAVDRERRWVRTLSRFYSLGPATLHGI